MDTIWISSGSLHVWLQSWFKVLRSSGLHYGGSGLRLDVGPDVKLSSDDFHCLGGPTVAQF